MSDEMELYITIEAARVERWDDKTIAVYPPNWDEPAIWMPVIEYTIQPGDLVEWKGVNGVGWYRINKRQWWRDGEE